MTISTFCRDQLLAQGPLSLETLTDLAVDAGKTTAQHPVSAVRSAIAYKEVLLADGRWATPLWLLEGRILTARRLLLDEPWPELAIDDERVDVLAEQLFWDEPELHDVPDGTHHDLALLSFAARAHAVPLAAGGLLRSSRYGSGWRPPKGWPGARPGHGELFGLRVREGLLHVEVVPMTDELFAAGDRLAHTLGPLAAPARYWSTEDSRVSDNLSSALWNRMANDPAFLTSPVPPFSECIPSLAVALRRERDRQAAEASRWRPQLDLPAAAQRVAVRGARRSGQLLDEWLNAYVVRTMREIDDGEDGWVLDHGCADVLPLQRRPRRV